MAEDGSALSSQDRIVRIGEPSPGLDGIEGSLQSVLQDVLQTRGLHSAALTRLQSAAHDQNRISDEMLQELRKRDSILKTKEECYEITIGSLQNELAVVTKQMERLQSERSQHLDELRKVMSQARESREAELKARELASHEASLRQAAEKSLQEFERKSASQFMAGNSVANAELTAQLKQEQLDHSRLKSEHETLLKELEEQRRNSAESEQEHETSLLRYQEEIAQMKSRTSQQINSLRDTHAIELTSAREAATQLKTHVFSLENELYELRDSSVRSESQITDLTQTLERAREEWGMERAELTQTLEREREERQVLTQRVEREREEWVTERASTIHQLNSATAKLDALAEHADAMVRSKMESKLEIDEIRRALGHETELRERAEREREETDERLVSAERRADDATISVEALTNDRKQIASRLDVTLAELKIARREVEEREAEIRQRKSDADLETKFGGDMAVKIAGLEASLRTAKVELASATLDNSVMLNFFERREELVVGEILMLKNQLSRMEKECLRLEKSGDDSRRAEADTPIMETQRLEKTNLKNFYDGEDRVAERIKILEKERGIQVVKLKEIAQQAEVGARISAEKISVLQEEKRQVHEALQAIKDSSIFHQSRVEKLEDEIGDVKLQLELCRKERDRLAGLLTRLESENEMNGQKSRGRDAEIKFEKFPRRVSDGEDNMYSGGEKCDGERYEFERALKDLCVSVMLLLCAKGVFSVEIPAADLPWKITDMASELKGVWVERARAAAAFLHKISTAPPLPPHSSPSPSTSLDKRNIRQPPSPSELPARLRTPPTISPSPLPPPYPTGINGRLPTSRGESLGRGSPGLPPVPSPSRPPRAKYDTQPEDSPIPPGPTHRVSFNLDRSSVHIIPANGEEPPMEINYKSGGEGGEGKREEGSIAGWIGGILGKVVSNSKNTPAEAAPPSRIPNGHFHEPTSRAENLIHGKSLPHLNGREEHSQPKSKPLSAADHINAQTEFLIANNFLIPPTRLEHPSSESFENFIDVLTKKTEPATARMRLK